MGSLNRDWQNEFENKKLSNSNYWCHYCQGLTVNALTLICSSCKRDNSQFHPKRNLTGHPLACTCHDCCRKRLGKS